MDRQLWLTGLTVLSFLTAATGAEPPDELKIAVWVRELGADRFQVRQQATKQLTCKEAINALVRALDHDDPEVATRAAEILFAIAQNEDEATHKAGEEKIEKLLKTDSRAARLLRAARGNHQSRAIDQLRGLGAAVIQQPSGGFEVRIGGSNRPVAAPPFVGSTWRGGDAGLILLQRFGPITILDFDLSCTKGDQPVTTKGLQVLEALGQVESIDLPKCVTDDAVKHLSKMKRLRRLEFNFSDGFTGEGLVHLVNLKSLEHIDLNQSNATSESFRHLAGLPKLRSLTTSQVSFGNDGLEHVGKMTSLTSLSLDNTRITDEGLADVARLKQLNYLNLSENAVSDLGLKHLHVLHQLRRIRLNRTFVSSDGVSALKAALPQVDVDGEFGGPLASSDSEIITVLSDLGAIFRREQRKEGNATRFDTTLDIYEVWWRGESFDLRQIEKLSKVRRVTIRGIKVLPEDREFLRSLPNIEKVHLLNVK